MANIRVKCVQVGLTIALGVFLGVNAKPLPQPDIEPALTAGAARLPLVDWRTTEVKIMPPEPEVETVAEPTPAPEPEAVEEPEPAPQPRYDSKDLLYRTVQAEGYTMGYEGMRYITSAILNLARDRGCSIYAVLTSGAYTVVNDGSIWRQGIYPETIAAVDDDLNSQIDTEIKYFRTGHYHGFGTPVMQYGNVYFSK